MHDLYLTALYYIGAIWRRRWAACLIAAVICLAGWTGVIFIPDSYQSSARIYVDTSNVLQPLLRGITVQSNLPAQVRLMSQTLLTRPNLESVARETDYDLSAASRDEMNLLIDGLKSRTDILATRENIFTIRYTDSNAQRAHDVVVALLEKFVENNLGESRQELDVASEFINDQIESYERLLQQAENELAAFKQENMELLAGEGGYLGRAANTQDQLRDIELEIDQARAQRSVLIRELESVPETLPADAVESGGPPSDSTFRLLEAESELRSLLSRYTENHPDVIAAQRHVDELLKKVDAESAALAEYAVLEIEGEGGVPNPFYQELKLRLIEQDARIGSLREKARMVRGEVDSLQQMADDVPFVEAQLKQLNRDYDVLKRKHGELLTRRESAKLSSEREERGSEVDYRLIEPATVPIHPSGPNRPLLLSGVLFAGLAAGIAFAVALILVDTSFLSVKDLRERISLPIYGPVSEVSGFASTASTSANVFAMLLFMTGLLGVFATLMALEQQFGLGSLATEEVTPELFVKAIDVLRGAIFRIIS